MFRCSLGDIMIGFKISSNHILVLISLFLKNVCLNSKNITFTLDVNFMVYSLF